MARILFTSTLGSPAWAGSEVLWFKSAQELTRRGHTVAATLPEQMRTPENCSKLEASGITAQWNALDKLRYTGVRLSRRFRPKSPTAIAPIVRHATQWRADIAVLSQASCWGAYSEMLALESKGIPYIGISQLNTPFSWPRDPLFEEVGNAFTKAKAAIFVSKANLELFENQIAKELKNAQIIFNPPSFDTTVSCGPVKGDAMKLLNVARIDPSHKGQDLILDVLCLEKWRTRNVSLTIAGEGNSRWIKALIASKNLQGSVHLLGHVDELKPHWEDSAFGIFPSRYEGMPLALIEGMSLGRANVATDVAGHREWINHGECGFLSSGCTVSSLDHAMEEAWNSREIATQLGESARKRAMGLLKDDPAAKLADIIETHC